MIFKFLKSLTIEKDQNNVSDINDAKVYAKSFLETMLKKSNFESLVIINNDFPDLVYLSIENTSDTSRIIGKEGATLIAIQTIVKSILSKKYGGFFSVFIDCNDYLSLKIDKIQAKVKELEKKLSPEKNTIELFPMSPIERKAVHTLYQNRNDISTYSVGEGNDRRVVIKLN